MIMFPAKHFLAPFLLFSFFFILELEAAEIRHEGHSEGILQALCNNRGIAFAGKTSWTDLDNFKRVGLPPGVDVSKIPKSKTFAECTRVDETVGEDNGVENSLWYWREDILLNAQHLFWHMAHPQHLVIPDVPLLIHRRGEMFDYLHRNLIARYNAERLGFGLARAAPLVYVEGGLVEQGYNPHLLDSPHEFRYPQRFPGDHWTNTTGTWLLDIINGDIDNRHLVATNGTFVPLDNFEGIDRLGEMMEASINSVNPARYSTIGYHSHGHRNMGYLHEDIGESVGDDLVCAVMFNPSTAMRDPIFYRWHTVVDNIFLRHKALLTPNHPTEGDFPLIWPGVVVSNLTVQSHNLAAPANMLSTFFKNLTVEIPLTKDIFFKNESYEYCIKHLSRDEFSYTINIEKQENVSSDKATVRVFLAPRYNEFNETWSMDEQNIMFFAIDRFTVELKNGTNTITRNASDSSLLLNWSLEEYFQHTPNFYEPECGCGWPSHLLLPRGSPGGQAFDFFVMVTDAEIDIVDEFIEGADPSQEPGRCKMGEIWNGIKDKKYPDARPMGYPFNTRTFNVTAEGGSTTRPVINLKEYVSLIPNSQAIKVVISHLE